jgi:hypothetical protein
MEKITGESSDDFGYSAGETTSGNSGNSGNGGATA